VSDPQLAVFETAIPDRWVIKAFRSHLASAVDATCFAAQMQPTAGIRPENIAPILESRSPTERA
jgi:hypothetical protein